MAKLSIKKLYKDPNNGRITGVCAGIANYFGIKPGGLRLCAVIAFFLTGIFPTLVLYVLLSLALDEKPSSAY